jgi:hypothetical protein
MTCTGIAGKARPRITSVTVEYDCRGKRVRKVFTASQTARAFYAAKLKGGKNPKVISATTG